MANTKAFTVKVGPTHSGQGGNKNIAEEEGGAISQTNPAWVLTFVRWGTRDPLRTPNSSSLDVREPAVVENDCIGCSVTVSKSSHTPSMTATLVQTDINWETEVAPGDFVFVNMLNWEEDARRVAIKAKGGKPINGVGDGFKGIFKVQSVRKTLGVDPQTGIRSVLFKIDGFGFTEFNNTIYFNPNLVNQKSLGNVALYIADLAPAWASLVTSTGFPHIQDIQALLIQSLIGSGVSDKAKHAGPLLSTPNTHFQVPTLVGKLLDIDSSSTVTAAKDIYNYLFGIQQYGSSDGTLSSGMNPSNLPLEQEYPGFYYTNDPCPGNSILKAEYWNQVTLWSIMQQYTNAPLNELFTCYRVDKENRIMPTLVFRQIPFTSEDFETQEFKPNDPGGMGILVTKFLSLPRWKIAPESVFNMDIGREEAARINFVQFYAKSNFSSKGVEMSGETAAGNIALDDADVLRSGLKPYIIQNQFDDLTNTLVINATRWARILGDALIGGHLKMNGTISCIGISEPIAVGDNLEFDGIVYHIEQVSHTCVISGQDGRKTFRTNVSLSHGVSVHSNANGTKYAEMGYPNAYSSRLADWENSQILPGVSESQDTQYRNKDTDRIDADSANETTDKNGSFVQPSTGKDKTGRVE